MKSRLLMLAAVAALSVGAGPVVSDVAVTNDGTSQTVTIDYVLADEPAIVTIDVLTNNVSIGLENVQRVAGDLYKIVQPGARRITWRPDLSWPGQSLDARTLTVDVKAWATNNPPDYMVVDLNMNKTRFYYPTAEAVPRGIHDELYKTYHLLMRRVPAAGVTWRMGSTQDEVSRHDSEPLHYVTLSEDYYIGVFELTLMQYEVAVGNTLPNADWHNLLRPVNLVYYQNLRGSSLGPENGTDKLHEVTANSLFGRLRARTGLMFDLPTDAQWEFAYRAGSGTPCYNGAAVAGDAIAITMDNSGNDLALPGTRQPNAWGLYDMAGNAWEWCLDEYDALPPMDENPATPVVDPVKTGYRTIAGIIRGGSFGNGNWDARAARRETFNRDSSYPTIGCRVCCPVK